MPSIIASQITGVQPMQGKTGSIFTLKVRNETETESWRKKFIFWPKKSIYGKMIVGRVNERGRWHGQREVISGEGYVTHQVRIVEYATDKEIFKETLAGTA